MNANTNNVNAEAMTAFVEAVKADPHVAEKHKQVDGTWCFDGGEPQFTATLEFTDGAVQLGAELPDFAGGWGTSPDPVQYCLYGLGACYAAVFAATATAEGVALTSLAVKVENWMDLHKQIGLSSEDIIKRCKFTIHATGAPEEAINKIAELARARCPGVECLTRSIPFELEVAS